jgi:hypothetical protein
MRKNTQGRLIPVVPVMPSLQDRDFDLDIHGCTILRNNLMKSKAADVCPTYVDTMVLNI